MRVPARTPTRVEGSDACFVELGDRAGPPVVLVPGLTDGLSPLFRPGALRRLATVPLPIEQVRAVALSYPDPLPPRCTTRQLATDLAGLLDRLLDRPAVLVGHSMGGMVAQHLAADRPDLVRGLVLSATTGCADERVRRTLRRWEALLSAGDVAGFARDAVARSFTGAERARRLLALQSDDTHTEPRGFVARHLALSRACGSHDATARLGRIVVPALVLAAGADRVVPADHTRRLADALPGARFHRFAHCGHGFPEQDAGGYRREVEPFIASLTGSSLH